MPKDSVGRQALFNLLRSNLDMFSVCVDRCYDRDSRIGTGYFQVGQQAMFPRKALMLQLPCNAMQTCSAVKVYDIQIMTATS